MPFPRPADPLKPTLRGVFHFYGFLLALVAGTVLVLSASSLRARLAVSVYSISLAAMFGASALYHLPRWGPRVETWLLRLDHAAIFVFIAGSYTPFCLLALRNHSGNLLLTVVWIVAGLGILRALLWIHAPPLVATSIYLLQGWLLLPFLPSLAGCVGPLGIGLIAAGGLCYTAGAVIFALRRPDPLPRIFGYHELFHALVLAGCICVFGVVAGLSLG